MFCNMDGKIVIYDDTFTYYKFLKILISRIFESLFLVSLSPTEIFGPRREEAYLCLFSLFTWTTIWSPYTIVFLDIFVNILRINAKRM